MGFILTSSFSLVGSGAGIGLGIMGFALDDHGIKFDLSLLPFPLNGVIIGLGIGVDAINLDFSVHVLVHRGLRLPHLLHHQILQILSLVGFFYSD